MMSDLIFEPKSENDLIDILETGQGDYEILEATKKTSKASSNPMIELKIKVWDAKGQEGIIYDYLMLTNSKFSLRKIRHFCYSCGLGDLYEKGKLSAFDCNGQTGKLKISLQSGTNGYSDKNVVNDYLINEEIQKKEKKEIESDFDDDIPF
jgi:hypothetical protein